MIGLIIPAHQEEKTLAPCLAAALELRHDPGLKGEEVRIIVVLDACTDASEAIATGMGVDTLRIDARNVGAARALGARHALALGARWLAFTDSDTVVSRDWLSAQLALGADAVCGTIGVDDWSAHPPEVRARFAREYVDACGHRHIHGANLGVSREAYLAVGGFQPLASKEDVAIVGALSAAGYSIAWSARPRVTTSARKVGRAPGGFADAILRHCEELGDILSSRSSPASA